MSLSSFILKFNVRSGLQGSSHNMTSNLAKRLKGGLGPAKGAKEVHGEDIWLDNDDIRPLKLEDRTWSLWTYLTFWFSASELFASHADPDIT